MLTTSPVTMPSPRSGRAPRATTASPVVTAARTAMSRPSERSSSIVSRIRSAERTARSASSSCATGAPKTAMTASPMNFSTVPPNRSMSVLTRSWYGRSVARTSSGSARSDWLVNPTRSTKSTETTFRSSPAGVSATSNCPHVRQKRARSGFSSPQCGQTSTRGSSQRPEVTSTPQAPARKPARERTRSSARRARSPALRQGTIERLASSTRISVGSHPDDMALGVREHTERHSGHLLGGLDRPPAELLRARQRCLDVLDANEE